MDSLKEYEVYITIEMRENQRNLKQETMLGLKTHDHSNNVLVKSIFSWTTKVSSSSKVQWLIMILYGMHKRFKGTRLQTKKGTFSKPIPPSQWKTKTLSRTYGTMSQCKDKWSTDLTLHLHMQQQSTIVIYKLELSPGFPPYQKAKRKKNLLEASEHQILFQGK